MIRGEGKLFSPPRSWKMILDATESVRFSFSLSLSLSPSLSLSLSLSLQFGLRFANQRVALNVEK